MEDVDGDGDIDLMLLFRFADTGIRAGDTHVVLSGVTFDGRSIIGPDTSGLSFRET